MKYTFYPDKLIIVITIICIVALISMVYYLFLSKSIYSKILTFSVICLIVYFLFKIPLWIRVEENSIQVKQLIGSLRITNIETITEFKKKELNKTIRTFGNGGFGGYVGYFRNPDIGKFYMAAINRNELAKITTKEGKVYVINYPSSLLNINSK
ncbi:MAG: hypothetical protein GX963_10950 [Bacteroidales bacterium]|nr:hypothetical protein [Bacteroidales bacterium]